MGDRTRLRASRVSVRSIGPIEVCTSGLFVSFSPLNKFDKPDGSSLHTRPLQSAVRMKKQRKTKRVPSDADDGSRNREIAIEKEHPIKAQMPNYIREETKQSQNETEDTRKRFFCFRPESVSFIAIETRQQTRTVRRFPARARIETRSNHRFKNQDQKLNNQNHKKISE